MKKIIKLLSLSILIFLTGCSTTERSTREKASFLTEFIIENAIYNGYNLEFGKESIKTKSTTKNETNTTTNINTSGGVNTHTTIESTTKTKSTGVGFGIGIGDY